MAPRPGVYLAKTEDEMIALGARLAREWRRAAGVVLLIGNLGAGKTTLAKGIVEGLGVERAENVSSPTFPLIHEYGNPVAVYHVDLYRLDTRAELDTLGLDEIFATDTLVLIEWGEKFAAAMPAQRREVRISEEADGARRVEILERT